MNAERGTVIAGGADSRRGWWVVAATFVGLALSYAPFTVFVFGTLVQPLQAEFGWSRAEMSFALTVTNLTIVFGSPALGLLVDRFGPRRVVLPSVFLMGLALVAMTRMSANIWSLYLGFFAITVLGLGTLPHSYSRLLIGWFDRRLGLALGIALAGFGVGAALVPQLATGMTTAFGWRSAYLLFAALVLALSLPLAYCLLKERSNGEADTPSGPGPGLSGREAAGTSDYWLLLVSFFLVGIAITAILSHLVPMLIDRGMGQTAAARCMSALAVGLIFGRMLAGYLMDHLFAPFVTAGFITVGLAGGICLLALGAVGTWAFVAAVLVGLATGSEISEIAYMVGRYFGQRSFGLIYGLMFGAFQLGSSIAAPMMGYYHDVNGDYTGALWALVVVALVGALLVVLMAPYPGMRNRGSSAAQRLPGASGRG